MEEVNPRLKSSAGGVAFSACTAASVLVSLVAVLILSAANVGRDATAYKYISYLVAPAAIALGAVGTAKYYKQKFSDVLSFKCKPVYFLIALLMAFGLIFCLSYTNTGVLEILKRAGYKPREDSSYIPPLDGWLLLPALVCIAVIPAVAEEFFFRGALLSNARSQMGDIRAVFTVGFCFCIFHANPEQTVYQFICGCAFALITIRSGSVLPALFIHFLNNAFVLVLYSFGYSSLPFSVPVQITLGVLGGAAFAIGVLWLIFIKKPFKKGEKGGVKAFFICAAPGIAVNAVMWIVSLFGV